MERFEEEPLWADGEGLDDPGEYARVGDDDGCQMGVQFSAPAQHGQPLYARHLDVHHQQVKADAQGSGLGLQTGNGLTPVGHSFGGVAMLGK